jgi:hypothetical protein
MRLLHPWAVALLLSAALADVAQAGAEQRIQGTVLQTRVTLCQFKPRGCAGFMVMELAREGRREQVTVQVRLGVPIRHEEDYVLLATLRGSVVSVVHVIEKGAIVAKSIEVTTKAAR